MDNSDVSVVTRKKQKSRIPMGKRSSVGAELSHLDVDKTITTDPCDYSKRRTLQLHKHNGSWGFTLQTYGINHKRSHETEILTYVDYVDIGGSAWLAGMRRGDVILSVNGNKVGETNHQQLVEKIRNAGNSLRLVVLFEDGCRKVDLHERFIKLKSVLKSKYQELKDIELQEMELIDSYCKSRGLNRFEHIRQSILSANSSSTGSDSWDAYSLVSSPCNLQSTGKFEQTHWSSATSLKSFSMGDSSSDIVDIVEDDFIYVDTESDGEQQNLRRLGTRGVATHSSDSNLVSPSTVTSMLQQQSSKEVRLSDSKLYGKSKSAENESYGVDRRSMMKVTGRSSQSLTDEVFMEESGILVDGSDLVRGDSGSVKGTGVQGKGSSGASVKRNGHVKMREDSVGEIYSSSVGNNQNGGAGEVRGEEGMGNSDGTRKELKASDSINAVRDLTLREQQVYYAGENGNIIVPKICLDGDNVFTTFEHIETSVGDLKHDSLSRNDSESYTNQVVAMEIAKEMAKLDKVVDLPSFRAVSEESIPDMFAKSLNARHGDKNGKKGSSPSLSTGPRRKTSQTSISSAESQTENSGKNNTSLEQQQSSSLERAPKKISQNSTIDSKNLQKSSIESKNLQKSSIKTGESENIVPHDSGEFPVTKHKSSIPEIEISFHPEIPAGPYIYINEKDECTQL